MIGAFLPVGRGKDRVVGGVDETGGNVRARKRSQRVKTRGTKMMNGSRAHVGERRKTDLRSSRRGSQEGCIRDGRS